MDKLIIGIVCLGAGVYFALGIWFPQLRLHWGRTPVACGRVSSVGFALFPGALGVIMATLDMAAMIPFRVPLILTAIAGWNVAIWGAILDKRAYCKTSPERKAELRNFSPVPLLVFGIFFFALSFYLMVIHKNSE
jgi:hypothetical protein